MTNEEVVPLNSVKGMSASKRLGLSSETINKLHVLKTKRSYYNFYPILVNLLVIISIASIAIYTGNIWVYLASVILIGGRMRGFDNLIHEASHGLLFKNRRLNRTVAVLLSYSVFTTFQSYCNSHYDHHKYLWTDKDPDTVQLKKLRLHDNSMPTKRFIFQHIVLPMLLVKTPSKLWALVKGIVTVKDQNWIEYSGKLLFWTAIAGVLFVTDGWFYFLLYWIVPWLTVFQIIRYWSDIADHSGLESESALHSSRNSYGNVIERWIIFPHHDSYHLVHHLFPYIPHYHLKKAHLILLEDEAYRKAHHCTGFFKSIIPGLSSVIEDITKQEEPAAAWNGEPSVSNNKLVLTQTGGRDE